MLAKHSIPLTNRFFLILVLFLGALGIMPIQPVLAGTVGTAHLEDLTSPTVVSILRADPNPTSLNPVHFTVNFSEDVLNVDAGDFTLVTTGLTGAGITGVSGSGASYTVTVDRGSGNGTIHLNLVDDDSIQDVDSNPLGGIGLVNGDFSGGETYDIVIITISGNAGAAGVTLSYTEGSPKTATADENGAYSFIVPYNWSGTVTPSKIGFTFSPADRTYSNLTSDQIAQDYTALAITYTISGNAGAAGATLSYTDGSPKTATADGSGAYSFTVSYDWSGTVTPSKTGYTFSPADRTYSNVLADQTAQDYIATAITYTISGNASVAGATLSYTDGSPKTATADGSGIYSFTVSYDWSGTVTPSKSGYTFSPSSKTYSNITSDQTAQDYNASAIIYTISGNAGIAGVVLSYTDGSPKTVTADGSGNYSFTVSYDWSGTVTPSKTSFTFSPSDRNYSNVVADQTAQDYIATAITYTISGNAGVAGVTLSYTDGTLKTATTDNNGDYSFTVSYDWSGTVIPSKAGYTFSPASRGYSNVLSDQISHNYTATAITYTISGNAGVASATLSYTDGSPKTAPANGSGVYSFTVSYNWSGSVTPSKTGYTFTPPNKAYSNVLADQTGQNYTAAAITYTISGNAGVTGAILNYTDGIAKTATADSNGDYSFIVSYNWSGTVTPEKTGYTFTPPNKAYSNVLADQTGQNYTAAAIIYTISGNVGVAGATLSYTDGSHKTAPADGSGNYSFTVSYNWSGTVTPSKTGFTFSPVKRTYSNVTSNQVNQNYAIPAPSANFDAWPTSGNADLSVEFHIVSTLNVTSCTWDYGDGSTGTTCSSYHDHNYVDNENDENLGFYTVSLTVTGPGGSDSMTRPHYITVYPTLVVSKSGTGTGTVTSNPAGISCGTNCSGNFGYNSVVTLTAAASPGSTFAGWSGGGCSGTGTCTVTMTTATTVTANFESIVGSCPSIMDWKGEYWANKTLTGSPVVCRNDADLDFEWGLGSPDPLIPANNFSARWTKLVNFEAGTYRFYMGHDDGARLYIDNMSNPVFNKWDTCCVVDPSDPIPLTGGDHVIRMEHFENIGAASAQLWWEKIGPSVASVVRTDPSPTDDLSVHFNVVFSDAVTGVNKTAPFPDFALSTIGLNEAAITSISGSGTTYLVTVKTGPGSGTIRLDVVDDDSIKDAADNRLGGTGTGNGNFTAGGPYTIARYSNIDVSFGQDFKGSYPLDPSQSSRISYTGANNGPVKIIRNGGNQIAASERVIYGGVSYSEMMGLPYEQLSHEYLFPYYNNVAMSSQLRVSNLGDVPTTITVYLAGKQIDSYVLAAGTALRRNYPKKNKGPLRVTSSATDILATIRVLFGSKSYSELMGYPVEQLSREYWYPVYDNINVSSQLRVSNVGAGPTTITIYLAGVEIDSYQLQPGQAERTNYPRDDGPLQVVSSNEPILTTIRLLYKNQSLSEITGLPVEHLAQEYWYPVYDNVNVKSELRVANVGLDDTTISVYAGGVFLESFNLAAGGEDRRSFNLQNTGPLQVVSSDELILSTVSMIYKTSTFKSLYEMMGLPDGQLSTQYFFPWYNNVAMRSELRFAVP